MYSFHFRLSLQEGKEVDQLGMPTLNEIVPEIPVEFIRRTTETYGNSMCNDLLDALEGDPPVSIRLNPHKCSLTESLPYEKVPWCGEGIYLEERPSFILDPFWHAGLYYVQEAASMSIALYLKQLTAPPQIALDLCAAPGGKSTHLRNLLPLDTILVSNEPDPARASILYENILRNGTDECLVTSAYPSALRHTGLQCDLILVDAPCSGEGMFRKYPHAREEWSPENVAMCVTRQKDILDEAWEMLLPGGTLIYSTCTFNEEENEGQLDYLTAKGAQLITSLSDRMRDAGAFEYRQGCYHFFPHLTKGEGFSLFAITKPGTYTPWVEKSRKQANITLPEELSLLSEAARVSRSDGEYFAQSQNCESLALTLSKGGVKVLSAGVSLGSIKGKKFIPAHGWVSSPYLKSFIPYPKYEISEDQVLSYLSRNAIQIQADKGIAVAYFNQVPLGWLNNVGNRANNLYPKELAIRNIPSGEKLPERFSAKFLSPTNLPFNVYD